MIVNADNLHVTSIDPTALNELKVRAVHCVALDVHGLGLAVRFENKAAADFFRRRYCAFPPAGKAAFECFAVEGPLGPTFWAENGPVLYWPTPLIPRCIAFLADAVSMKAFFNSRDDLVSFHAAAVRVGDVAAAVFAHTNGGKTTTAIACARRGMQLYSDERCNISGLNVLPFPRNLNVRSGSVDLLATESVPGDLGITDRMKERSGANWFNASFEDIFGSAGVPPPRPLAAIFFIAGSAGAASAEPMPTSVSIAKFSRSGLRSAIRGFDRAALLARMLQNVRCYSLWLGTPDATATLIQKTVSAQAAVDPLAFSA